MYVCVLPLPQRSTPTQWRTHRTTLSLGRCDLSAVINHKSRCTLRGRRKCCLPPNLSILPGYKVPVSGVKSTPLCPSTISCASFLSWKQLHLASAHHVVFCWAWQERFVRGIPGLLRTSKSGWLIVAPVRWNSRFVVRFEPEKTTEEMTILIAYTSHTHPRVPVGDEIQTILLCPTRVP